MAEPTPEPSTGAQPGQWLGQTEAAARLGWHLERLKSAARRGKLMRRKGNAGQWLVFVPDTMPPEPDQGGDHADDQGMAEALAELREELTEAKVAAAHAAGQVAALSAALTREQQRADQLQAALDRERTPLLVRLVRATRWGGSSAT